MKLCFSSVFSMFIIAYWSFLIVTFYLNSLLGNSNISVTSLSAAVGCPCPIWDLPGSWDDEWFSMEMCTFSYDDVWLWVFLSLCFSWHSLMAFTGEEGCCPVTDKWTQKSHSPIDLCHYSSGEAPCCCWYGWGLLLSTWSPPISWWGGLISVGDGESPDSPLALSWHQSSGVREGYRGTAQWVWKPRLPALPAPI